MRAITKSIIIVVVIVLILIIATVGLSIYGYNQLETDFDATNFSPEFNTSLENVLHAFLDFVTFNYLEVVTDLIDGVRIDGTLRFTNHSFIPLYIPEMEHEVYIEGQQCQKKFITSSFWLGPSSHQYEPISIVVDLEDVPEILYQVLVNGGTSNVKIYSEFSIGTFTIVKESTKSFAITNPISSYTGSSSSNAQITFTGWHISGSPVASGYETDTVTAQITLSNGDSGMYTMRVRQDVSLGNDQTVQEKPFSYDGSTTTQQISFTPPYATGESGTDGYHIDVIKDGVAVWTMADSYPPRLYISTTPGGPLSINFNGWFVNSIQVNSCTKGDTVTAFISLSGGETGNYIIQIRRDINFGADETVKQVTISYDATPDIVQVSFIPEYATGEASTNGYHIDILEDGVTLWSMTNSYPPRLRVVST